MLDQQHINTLRQQTIPAQQLFINGQWQAAGRCQPGRDQPD
ncbi:MAG: hypothetical protein R3E89_01775 [Thiolinea sp.]